MRSSHSTTPRKSWNQFRQSRPPPTAQYGPLYTKNLALYLNQREGPCRSRDSNLPMHGKWTLTIAWGVCSHPPRLLHTLMLMGLSAPQSDDDVYVILSVGFTPHKLTSNLNLSANFSTLLKKNFSKQCKSKSNFTFY